MKKNRKGFTLVELLAVIVILAIILSIAIPGISTIINSASRSSLESSAKMVLKAIEYKMLEDDTFIPSDVNETNIKSLLSIGDENYQSLTVKEVNDVMYVTIVGKNKWDKLTVSGTKMVAKVNDTVTTLTRGSNSPVLATGMTPIKWDGTTWVNTTVTDTAWYNYDTTNKIWANAKTADGSMWVWIPRYIYKISTGWHTSTAGAIDIQFTKGIDDNWNKASIGNIILDESATSSNGTWTNHPAFTFGDTELTGVWVAKFEASGTTSAVNFVPNVVSFRSQTIDTFFTESRNMETNARYGWGTTGNDIDTHMMKNTEWGAVAYLAQSTYGKNSEIWINNSSTFITGCAGVTVTAAPFAGCENAYNTTNGLQTSTTGNINGIYDMSGGAWEYVPAYVDNGHANLGNGSIIKSSDNKYRDVSAMGSTDTNVNNYNLTINNKGDATYETSANGTDSASSWKVDYSIMPRTDAPWFLRGGDNSATYAGAFSFNRHTGGAGNVFSFRSVLLVSEGL